MNNKTYNTYLLEAYCRTHKVTLVKEFKYVPGREFKADYYIPEWRMLIEVQGGVFNKKAHGSISGVLKDIERGNLATINGWRLLRIESNEFEKTQAILLLEQWRENQ